MLVADFQQMNFTQMHDRLRLELQRRIQRGTLSVSLLSRQTELGTSHLSNFLHGHRNLSLEAMDRILRAQRMVAADLLPEERRRSSWHDENQATKIPVVSHATAMFEPFIAPHAVQGSVHWHPAVAEPARPGGPNPRRNWERFVAICIAPADAAPMEPLLQPGAVVILDRHCVSLVPSRLNRANLFAVKDKAQLKVRYAENQLHCLILRPHSLAFPVELIALQPGNAWGDLLAGRVVHVQNEH